MWAQQFIAAGMGLCFEGMFWGFFEATIIYDQPERLNSGNMGLDSNVIQVKSEEFHQKT